MKAIEAIVRLKAGEMGVLRDEKWLMYLALTLERNVNLERLVSMEEIKQNYVLGYVEKTLGYLEGFDLNTRERHIVEEVLKWSETAKAGLAHQRRQWQAKGYNLFVHNIGSAQIYSEEASNSSDSSKNKQIIHDLIYTHGLIGQYIRGEVPLDANEPLYRLACRSSSIASAPDSQQETLDIKKVLMALNYCIINAVDESIWTDIHGEVVGVICQIIEGRFDEQLDLKERIMRLRAVSIKYGEAFDEEYERVLSDPIIVQLFNELLEQSELWYVEAALFDFSFEEFVKVFLLINLSLKQNKTKHEEVRHISFEHMMKDLYYQHEGKKRINIYKKRIIEKYLEDNTIGDILSGDIKENPHVRHVLELEVSNSTSFFTFRFSPAGSKLIEFCVEAERSDVLYESAVVLLFDLFGLRRDKYDRFYEEERYLSTMNQSIDYKKIILDYITGRRILDIGPGGGALMDIIEERFPDKQVMGVDIAQNVLDALKKKKQVENRKWDVVHGDALHLDQYIQKGTADTIIYCSILHELYSYIEYDGRKFNHETLACALKSAFQVLPSGGRIIIRDGIMTEPVEQKRIIQFLSEDGLEFLARYAGDFMGRQIQYTITGHNEVTMPVNDAMEFLYTYTWGEKSYVHEVNEQFGYFTPSGFKDFIRDLFGDDARITEFKHFLQEGYSIALSPKIRIFDENRNATRLPDSTCLMIIEKV